MEETPDVPGIVLGIVIIAISFIAIIGYFV
jgi:hypothetical protein